MSVVDDIATMLLQAGVTAVVYRGLLPDNADDPDDNGAVAVLDYAGLPPEYAHDDADAPGIERPNFQIMVRRKEYQDAERDAYAAWRAIPKFNTWLGTTFYQEIAPLDSPSKIDVDETDRIVFVANFTTRRKVPNG